MNDSLDIEFEKAVRFLAENLPLSQLGSKKPILAHDIRVGVFLFERNYSRDIILAGVLHDALEFSRVTEQTLKNEFGENVMKLVSACSKDRSIENSDERIDELVKRCAENGKDALIVKAADTIDSFKHYTKENNKEELEYCRKNKEAIFKHMPEGCSDSVFDELKES